MRKSRRILISITSGGISLVCSLQPSLSREMPFYFTRPNVTWDQYQADVAHCTALANKTQSPGTGYQPSLIGVAVSGFMAGVEKSKARRLNFQSCMQSLDYEKKSMTEDQAIEFEALEESKRPAMLESLVTGNDKVE